MLRDRYRMLPRMNFTSPYVDLPKRLTVRENLRVFADLYGVARAVDAHRRAVAELDLVDLLKRPYGHLSAGQRTRVSLAKALLNRPDVLLLDEPTASLDPDIGDRMRTYLENYQRTSGCTMLLASHNMSEVERMCADVIMLRAGNRRRPGIAHAIDRALRPRHDGRSVSRHRAGHRRARSRGRRGRSCRERGRRRAGRCASRRSAVAAAHSRADPAARVSAARIVAAARLDGVLPDGHDGALGVPDALPRASNQFLADAPGFFIGAVLLWDVLFRGQLGVSLTFIEEIYARNLGNLFVSPLRLHEFIIGQLTMSVMRTLIGVGGACLFAWLLFRYSIFSMGLPLDRLLRLPARLRLGDRARRVGDDPAPWSGGRGARVGRDFHHCAGIGRLLPDRRPAAGVAGRSVTHCRRRTCSKGCARCCCSRRFATISFATRCCSTASTWR